MQCVVMRNVPFRAASGNCRVVVPRRVQTQLHKGKDIMKTSTLVPTTLLLLAFGCAGNYPPPTQRLADVQSANRSANELGAQNNPKAQLHLKLAEEQLALAKTAMENDDNQRADSLLTRAKADAELAVALVRESNATLAANSAVDQSNAQRSTNSDKGAAQ